MLIAPDRGSRNKASIPGMAIGKILISHKKAQVQNTANECCASGFRSSKPGIFILLIKKNIPAAVR